MSDEFLQVATKEINDEIASINKILKLCQSDSDIFTNSQNLDDHIHKIKGLAPMMGKPNIGIIAALNDSILNHIIDGTKIEGIFSLLNESINFMDDSMKGTELKVDEIKQKIETKYSKYLD